MNKEDLIEYIENNRFSIYNNWSNHENVIKCKVDMLIKYYQKDLIEDNVILKAKVYAYERIISNSNFAPILKENKKDKMIKSE